MSNEYLNFDWKIASNYFSENQGTGKIPEKQNNIRKINKKKKRKILNIPQNSGLKSNISVNVSNKCGSERF